MSSSRTRRFAVAIFAMLSLLWAQLAVASYVCPQQAAPAAMTGMVMTPSMPCDAMDKAQPALCHQASDPTPPTADAVKLPTPSLPMIVQALELPLVLDVDDASARSLPEAPDLRPPPNPLFLSTLRLRV